MPELSVAVVVPDREQRTLLQVMIDGTGVARVVQTCLNFPVAATDPIIRRLQAATPNVIVIDLPTDEGNAALRGIELLRQELPEAAIFAIGSMSQPQVIVNVMRAGACEFFQRPTTTTDFLEAFVRLTAIQRKVYREKLRGKVFSVVNAKGGSGATTVAVNLALTLQAAHGNTALVDLAPLGHAALHLNLKPLFTVSDAIRNLHRLDSSLLDSFTTRHSGGLQLLAGVSAPSLTESTSAELARLFDMLIAHYRYVVVDTSTRVDPGTRLICNLSEAVLLVAQADVSSLWSASRIQNYLRETGGKEKIHLVLSRFRKLPGFKESDAEAAAGLKLLCKIPNYYFAVSSAIDRGVPVVDQGASEITRAFDGLAKSLTEHDIDVKRRARTLFKIG
jgi:pilus assembly protein CpaE